MRQQVEELKTKIIEHDNSLYMKTNGKVQSGPRCHHKFNEDTLHFITTEIEKNFDNCFKDLDRVMAKFSVTFLILSSAKSSQSWKKKKQRESQQVQDSSNRGKKEQSLLYIVVFRGFANK